MAAKRVDPLKAKEAKQKKIAVVGAVLLLALLGVQGPKTLKLLKGPQPVSSAASTTPAPQTAAPDPATAGIPLPGATIPATGTSAPTSGVELASLTDSDVPPTIEPGTLATFERFSSKDPFAQQAEPTPAPTRTSEPKDGTEAELEPAAQQPEKPAAAQGGEDGAAGGFTKTPTPVEVAAATSIAVNGDPEDVALEATFPADEPTFVLVSIAEDGRSIEIGIAGGEYAGGGETMKLKLGEKLTLQNTADGSRYELELLAIQGMPLPKKTG